MMAIAACPGMSSCPLPSRCWRFPARSSRRRSWRSLSTAPSLPIGSKNANASFSPAFIVLRFRSPRGLKSIARGPLPWPEIDADKAIPWVEKITGLTLADSQKVAIRSALVSKVMVITGGPGVGKTTLVNAILRASSAQRRSNCSSAPPLGVRRNG